MARKKLTMDSFQGAQMDKQAQQEVKGGYKYGPSGAGFVGSFVWETIDIRNNQEGNREIRDISEATYLKGRR